MKKTPLIFIGHAWFLLPDEVTMLGEDLHARALVAAVTDHKLTGVLHHSNLSKKNVGMKISTHAEPVFKIIR